MSGSRAMPTAEELDRINAEDRKAALDKKMAAHTAELDRARAAKAEQAAGSELVQFKARFDAELRGASDVLRAVSTEHDAAADAQSVLAECAKQVETLHAAISAAAHFLPLATRESCSKAVTELEGRLRAERERLQPKKKFGFKNRSKLAAAPMAVPSPPSTAGAAAVAEAAGGPGGGAADGDLAAAELLAATTARPHEDSFAAVADCVGFRRQRDVRLVRDAEGRLLSSGAAEGAGGGGGAEATAAGGDFALEELEGCEVRLLCASTALWVRGLSRCTVIAVPLPGSVYVTECRDCTFVLGARQVRLHISLDLPTTCKVSPPSPAGPAAHLHRLHLLPPRCLPPHHRAVRRPAVRAIPHPTRAARRRPRRREPRSRAQRVRVLVSSVWWPLPGRRPRDAPVLGTAGIGRAFLGTRADARAAARFGAPARVVVSAARRPAGPPAARLGWRPRRGASAFHHQVELRRRL